jgi:hypothetical protein
MKNSELVVKLLERFNTESYVRSSGMAKEFEAEGAKLRDVKDIFNSSRILGLLEIRGQRSGATYKLTAVGVATLQALKGQVK